MNPRVLKKSMTGPLRNSRTDSPARLKYKGMGKKSGRMLSEDKMIQLFGKRKIDSFVIGKTIGKGSYALVKLAVDKGSEKRVVLKIYEKYKLLKKKSR